MSASPLGEEEVWLLRCINKHCRMPGQGCAVHINYTPCKAAKCPAAKEILDRMRVKDFQTLAGSLQAYGYIGTRSDTDGMAVWITPKGKTDIYEIDHPDLVEKIIQGARHHPVWSLVIIVCMVLGFVAAFISQWRGCLSQ